MFYAGHTVTEIAGQALIAGFFIYSGYGNIRNAPMWAERMRGQGVPFHRLVLWAGFGVQFIGAVLVLADVYAAVGAGMLIAFTVIAMLLFQRYWEVDDAMSRRTTRLAFLGNVCILGGLLLMIDV